MDISGTPKFPSCRTNASNASSEIESLVHFMDIQRMRNATHSNTHSAHPSVGGVVSVGGGDSGGGDVVGCVATGGIGPSIPITAGISKPQVVATHELTERALRSAA